MKLYEQVMAYAEQLFADKQPHTVREIREKCEESGLSVKEDRNIINNVLAGMKRRGLVENGTEKGVYVPILEQSLPEASVPLPVEKAEAPLEAPPEETPAPVAEPDLDWERFFVLKPDSGRIQAMRVSITEKGELRLNSKLQKEIHSQKIEIIFSKDYKTLLLHPNGTQSHTFTKAGTIKNNRLVEPYMKMKLKFPVTYAVEWSEKYQMWMGTLEIPPKK